MSSPTELHLPPNFPYPIKVISIDANGPATIERGTRLLSYSFVHISGTHPSQPETRFGTWDSAIEGTVDSWKIKPGDVISERKARERAVVAVTEPCKHGVQMGGLCGLCGKDMTDYDYTGFSDASRASIQMTHSAFGPTVSLEEAQKIERETAEHLFKSRKLSLIVDLDQTIVHATVDPTVGEWISEGEAWEAKRAKRASSSKGDQAEGSTSDSEDECNPNWDALRDVKKFRLSPEPFASVSLRAAQYKGKGKNKQNEVEGCVYYIKPRPGWKDFLTNMAKKYEMHIYTMGTRAYAEEVCAALDPDSKIFGNRILSRDESGSLTQKSLQRLFPCDTSKVVIIDDRADVWEWSPNLIKVIPYDFFVGIGDINSSFLPKVDALAASVPTHQPTGDAHGFPEDESPRTDISPSAGSFSQPPTSTSAARASQAQDAAAQSSPDEKERVELTTKAMLTQNTLAIEAQLEERPLAKKQEALQGSSEGSKSGEERPDSGQEGGGSSTDTKEVHNTTPSKTEKIPRKALLKNDDTELERVSKLLEEVHSRFFRAYEERDKSRNRRPRSLTRTQVPYDVTSIIPQIRAEILQGVHILFSSVIPLDMNAESTEIWRMAHMFGARCSTELTSDITHVVAAKRGTVKVDSARKRKGIKIVWLAWFTDSIALWHHQDEVPYLLDDPSVPIQSSSPVHDSNQTSSEPEPDTDDWDDTQNMSSNQKSPGFELDEINWDDINDEVNAAMNESDDEDDKSQRSGMLSGNVSEDGDQISESGVTSANNTPVFKRKRLRSVTPSDIGANGANVQDSLHSPLSKRKKLAAERTGYSKLKQAVNADDLKATTVSGQTETRVTPIGSASESGMDDDDDDDDEGDGEEDEDDDFLARELGEEDWG